MTHRTLATCLLSSTVAFVLSACGEDPPQIISDVELSEVVRADSHSVNFGTVSVDQGKRVLKHEFLLTNETTNTKVIDRLKQSCGCVDVAVDHDSIAPGESASLFVSISVSTVGPVQQTAHVIYKDGTVEQFRLSAVGTRQHEVRLIPLQSPYDARTKTVSGDIFVLDNSGKGEIGDPVAETPPGIHMIFKGWKTIEQQSEHRLRPTRQIGSYVLDLSGYQGEFPLEVQIISASGVKNTFIVTQPVFYN